MNEIAVLKKRVERERLARKQAEAILENKALELFNTNEKLKKLNENLEQTIAQRTEELNKAKLTAEQSQRAEQQFLANMSHEIRTPMNAVIGMTHLLYETSLTPVQKDYVNSLQFSADNLMGLINNILDLSKIEAGELKFEEEPFNLHKLMIGLHRAYALKLKNQPILVTLDFDPAIQNMILGDSTRLNQILNNLLSNAGKFTQHGAINLRVLLLKKETHKYWIEFQIQDSGIGIPTDKVDLIFQNFKQADTNISRKYGGTGLGLTIVKELVELQGGLIKVESNLGEGSNFKVLLPLPYTATKAGEEEEKNKENRVLKEYFLKKLLLLVVEDNEMNQKLITKILEIWDVRFDLCRNGMEAINLTKTKQYDMILMDINMPILDGVEATNIIRKDPSNINHKTPIMAMTAAALLEEKNKALQAGMNDYITKPFSPNILLDKIYYLMNKESQKPETAIPEVENKHSITPSFNLEYLYNFSNGDEQFVKDMVHTFLKEIPNALEVLETAIVDKDWKIVHNTAHRLKPNFMMLGMKNQQLQSETIEQMIKKEKINKTKFEFLTKQIKDAVLVVFPLLNQHIQKG